MVTSYCILLLNKKLSYRKEAARQLHASLADFRQSNRAQQCSICDVIV